MNGSVDSSIARVRATPGLAVMVGPDPHAKGGMATVARNYQDAGLFSDGSVVYLATHRTGPLPIKIITAALALAKCWALMLRGRGRVLHVMSASGVSFFRKSLFIWSAAIFRRAIIFHLHGGQFNDFLGPDKSGLRYRFVVSTLKRVDRILVLSNEMQGWLAGLGLPASVRILPNPIPAALTVGHAEQRRRDTADRAIVFLGELSEAKGLHDLIASFGALAKRGVRCRLLIAGPGDQARWRELAKAAGCGESCEFVGWVDGERKTRLFQAASAVALPSYHEGQPMVVLEAMVRGVPVVATRVGGLPDITGDGRFAHLIEPGDRPGLADQLERAISGDDSTSRMAAEAQRYASTVHAPDAVCEGLVELYHQLANRQS